MKKAFIMLMTLVLMLTAACQDPQKTKSPAGGTQQPEKPAQSSGDIQMTVKEQTVSGDIESVTLTIKNVSGKEYSYGAMLAIEAEKDGTWEEVKPNEDVFWDAIAYLLSPGQSREEPVWIKS